MSKPQVIDGLTSLCGGGWEIARRGVLHVRPGNSHGEELNEAGGRVHSLQRIPEDESIGSFGVKRKNGGKGGEFTLFKKFKTRSVHVVNCETLPFFFFLLNSIRNLAKKRRGKGGSDRKPS